MCSGTGAESEGGFVDAAIADFTGSDPETPDVDSVDVNELTQAAGYSGGATIESDGSVIAHGAGPPVSVDASDFSYVTEETTQASDATNTATEPPATELPATEPPATQASSSQSRDAAIDTGTDSSGSSDAEVSREDTVTDSGSGSSESGTVDLTSPEDPEIEAGLKGYVPDVVQEPSRSRGFWSNLWSSLWGTTTLSRAEYVEYAQLFGVKDPHAEFDLMLNPPPHLADGWPFRSDDDQNVVYYTGPGINSTIAVYEPGRGWHAPEDRVQGFSTYDLLSLDRSGLGRGHPGLEAVWDMHAATRVNPHKNPSQFKTGSVPFFDRGTNKAFPMRGAGSLGLGSGAHAPIFPQGI